MKNFYSDLKKHATKIISYERKKKIIPLKNEENKSYHMLKVFHNLKTNLVLMIMIKIL